MSLSPMLAVFVDQNSSVSGPERSKLPLKEREVEGDHEAGRFGIARHRGKEEGRWRTARSSWVELIRRKPKEKVDVGSVRTGWNWREGSGVAVKPLCISWSLLDERVEVVDIRNKRRREKSCEESVIAEMIKR